jgi:hypothetical protein
MQKAAITTDPDFSIAINTLGVVYRKQAMFAEVNSYFATSWLRNQKMLSHSAICKSYW